MQPTSYDFSDFLCVETHKVREIVGCWLHTIDGDFLSRALFIFTTEEVRSLITSSVVKMNSALLKKSPSIVCNQHPTISLTLWVSTHKNHFAKHVVAVGINLVRTIMHLASPDTHVTGIQNGTSTDDSHSCHIWMHHFVDVVQCPHVSNQRDVNMVLRVPSLDQDHLEDNHSKLSPKKSSNKRLNKKS